MKGIMFSDDLIPMVLDGSKTMTRRIMKEQPKLNQKRYPEKAMVVFGMGNLFEIKPRYRVGETVYVKEAWRVGKHWDCKKQSEISPNSVVDYKVDKDDFYDGKWRNKMYMPEWASRCKLEITGVRAERIQYISPEDVVKEGINPCGEPLMDAVRFQKLWETINGEGSWLTNPWVWVYEFRRVS